MEQKSNGALISSIVIVILLILGGIYIWKTSVKNKIEQNQPSVQTTNSGSTVTSGIEQDLNSVDVSNLDKGL